VELATGRLRKLNSFPNKAVVLCCFCQTKMKKGKRKEKSFFFFLTPGQYLENEDCSRTHLNGE
jgi:hypothetical protein